MWLSVVAYSVLSRCFRNVLEERIWLPNYKAVSLSLRLSFVEWSCNIAISGSVAYTDLARDWIRCSFLGRSLWWCIVLW